MGFFRGAINALLIEIAANLIVASVRLRTKAMRIVRWIDRHGY